MREPTATLIRSARFRAERETAWRELENLVNAAEKRGLASLSFEQAQSLAALYRQALASLSLAREISLDKALLGYLEALCARAYLTVYAPQQRLGGLVSRLLFHGIPGAARRLAPTILLAYAILLLGFAVGVLLFLQDPLWYNTVMPESLAGGRGITSSREELLAAIYPNRESNADELAAFASYLFSHNARIAIFIFSLGVMACIPTALLTFANGVMLGAFVGLHAERGILTDILAWLSIHGITELSAVVVACAGGLHLGRAVLFPGQISRKDALRRNARDAVKLAVLAGIMLVAAAVLEGFARQLVQDPGMRVIIGMLAGLFWIVWLGTAGRTRQ